MKKTILGISLYAAAVIGACVVQSMSVPTQRWSEKGELCAQVTSTLTYALVPVQGGTFTMGATPEQGVYVGEDEKPAHKVTLDKFCIGKYEVTQRLWEQVMGTNPSHNKGADLPVENVNWEECMRFAELLNLRRDEMNLGEYSSWRFRLPTEAEWEYAARGGRKSRGYKYPGSNTADRVAWSIYNSGFKTHKVGTLAPNELGIYDMAGNVAEWCRDWYKEDYYKKCPSKNPLGSHSGSTCVSRGGAYGSNSRDLLRVSKRFSVDPKGHYDDHGLRLVLAPAGLFGL